MKPRHIRGKFVKNSQKFCENPDFFGGAALKSGCLLREDLPRAFSWSQAGSPKLSSRVTSSSEHIFLVLGLAACTHNLSQFTHDLSLFIEAAPPLNVFSDV